MKSFTEKQIAKEPTLEKQPIKETLIKESGKVEKHEKQEKPEKEKHEKEKHEKEIKEHKEQKDDKDKPEKEKHEKNEKAEKNEKLEKEKHEKTEKHEKEKHEKELKDRKQENKEWKEKEHAKIETLEKVQKDIEVSPLQDYGEAETQTAQTPEEFAAAKTIEKVAAIEKLPEKQLYYDKHHAKEFKFEKLEHKEWDKYIEYGNIPDPGPIMETRLAALEASVQQLLHFIPEALRPDLSQGALKNEGTKEPAATDAAKAEKPQPAENKEPDKGKKP